MTHLPAIRLTVRPAALRPLLFLLSPLRLLAGPADDAYRQAHACLTSNRFAEAAALFQTATAATNATSAAAAWLGRGEALFSAKQWGDAVRAYNALLAAYPESPLAPNALCARGFAELRAGRLADAHATFQSFAARHPGHALAATAAAAAETLSRTLAARDKQRAEAALARETAAINDGMQSGKWAEAAAAAERFLAAHPEASNVAEVRFIAASAAFRANDFPRAQKAYRLFLEQHPRHAQAPRAWLELGKALQALSLYGEAATAFAHANDRAQAAPLQAECLLKAGSTAEALRLYETLAQTAADKEERARAALALGDCYAAQEKWEEAERLFLSVETLHASEALRPVALGRLAGLYERAGQTNRAARARAELRRRYPAFN